MRTPSKPITLHALQRKLAPIRGKYGLGEFKKISDTEYQTDINNGVSMFIQLPKHPENKYNQNIFKPVVTESGPLPKKAFRVGYTDYRYVEDKRLLGYTWSVQKADSLVKEIERAKLA